MKKYEVHLQAEVSKSFRATLAAQSLDIDVKKKSLHHFSVTADLDTDFNIGLIVGASGSGKTTLAKAIYGEDCFETNYVDSAKSVIDQFPEKMEYETVANALNGIGLSSVPCWIKPVASLSNGQKARAEAALALASEASPVILDEWTSVVDRTVAKVMSHCVQKHARRVKGKVVLLSCHYDVIEWLDPDWIIDCNAQKFIDRRLLPQGERKRKEELHFDVREISSRSWANFSKYHYLSARLPGGKVYYYGLFEQKNQIGFLAFANYIPIRPGSTPIFHYNRIVIHPDYAGLGLGLKLVTVASKLLKDRYGFEIRGKFSSVPMYKASLKDPANWEFLRLDRQIGKTATPGKTMMRKDGFRENIKTFTFRFVG